MEVALAEEDGQMEGLEEEEEFELGLEGVKEKTRHVGRGNCQPFHPDVVAQLKSFWSAGMVGVGEKKYGEIIRLACAKTGLTRGQVKVSNQ